MSTGEGKPTGVEEHLKTTVARLAEPAAGDPERADRWESVDEPLYPRRIGRFRVVRPVGQGGMGDVFLAHDDVLDRPVAIKIPRADASRSIETRNRLQREAKLTAGMSHPNLVQVYEVGLWNDQCFVATQWAAGGDLASWLANHPGPAEVSWAVGILEQIAGVLAYCHSQNVVHLDLKPANILFDCPAEADEVELAIPACESLHLDSFQASAYRNAPNPESLLLTDFGLARAVERDSEATLSNVVVGTPMYMAPEQIESRTSEIGPRTDIFAFGIIMYELLFGQRPFQGKTAVSVLNQIRGSATLHLPKSPHVPKPLKAICHRCLEVDPADRYADAEAIREDLKRFRDNKPVHARQPTTLWRLIRWTKEPVRIREAGLIAIWLQGAMLISLLSLVGLKMLGLADAVPSTWVVLVRDVWGIVLFPTLPNIVAGYFTLKGRAWAFWTNALVSVCFVVLLCAALIMQHSPLTFYTDNPLAFFIGHFIVLSVAALQLTAHLIAVPAAWRAGRIAVPESFL